MLERLRIILFRVPPFESDPEDRLYLHHAEIPTPLVNQRTPSSYVFPSKRPLVLFQGDGRGLHAALRAHDARTRIILCCSAARHDVDIRPEPDGVAHLLCRLERLAPARLLCVGCEARSDDDVVQREEPVPRADDALLDSVDGCPADDIVLERLVEHLLVHHSWRGGVDEIGSAFHHLELALADEPFGALPWREVQADVVALPDDLV